MPAEPRAGGATASPGTWALWDLGFRPFFLLAAVFAAVSMLGWIAQFSGALGAHAHLSHPLWHAHEMIFGYAFAVIVGFLFTAVRNWTNQPTPSGRTLAAIVACWVAGRLLVLTPWPALAAIADAVFALAAAAAIAVPLVRSGNRRNLFFIGVIVAFGAGNLCFHLAMAGVIAAPAARGVQFGLDLIVFVMVVVGGRVIPMFTANAIPGAKPVRVRWLERIALGSVLALAALGLSDLPAVWVGIAAALAALAHGARLALWRPWLTVRNPILWILHLSYAWIMVYLALRALAAADLVSASLATHALTVGAIGGLTLGMMTRVARGHTGLPLEAGIIEVVAYGSIQAAAAVRVFVPLLAPQWTLAAVVVSGMMWAVAFGLFVVKFWPVLVRPRVDGRSG